jgi:hypothetical protein
MDLETVVNEVRARRYLKSQCEALIKARNPPAFLVQAVPLRELNLVWSEVEPKLRAVLKGGPPRGLSVEARSFVTPTLGGLEARGLEVRGSGKNPSPSPSWITAVHRNGYFHAVWNLRPHRTGRGGVIRREDRGFLSEFSSFASEFWDVQGLDHRYHLRLQVLDPKNVYLHRTQPSKADVWLKYPGGDELVCDDHVREQGGSIDHLADVWISQLFNAFGVEFT